MKKFFFIQLAFLLLSASGGNSGAYEYPFVNPYVASVIGTPAQYGVALPRKIKVRQFELLVFEERKIPDVFWCQDKLKYSLA